MAVIVRQGTGGGTTSPVAATWPAAPASGNILVAVVNSATVVTTPAGWTARVSAVGSQGFYVYEKTAGASESTAFSVVTSGDWPTAITLLELDATQVAGFDAVSTATETSTPATSKATTAITGTGTAGDWVLATAALHGMSAGQSTWLTAAWTASFTALVSSTVYGPPTTTNDAIGHHLATLSTSAPGAVAPTTATWTNNAFNQYGVQIGYKLLGPNGGVTGKVATATATAPAPTVSNGVSTPANVTATKATATAAAIMPGLDTATAVTGGGPAAVTVLVRPPSVGADASPVIQAVRAAATARARRPLVTTNLTVGPAFVAADGSKAILLGWWDGEEIQPVNISGYWDTGTTHSL